MLMEVTENKNPFMLGEDTYVEQAVKNPQHFLTLI